MDGEQEGDLLVLSWGSTFGSIKEAIKNVRGSGFKLSHAHLRYINPFPANLGEVLKKFKRILIPELNLGQLALLIRNEYLKEVIQYNKYQGQPFKVAEIQNKLMEVLGGNNGN